MSKSSNLRCHCKRTIGTEEKKSPNSPHGAASTIVFRRSHSPRSIRTRTHPSPSRIAATQQAWFKAFSLRSDCAKPSRDKNPPFYSINLKLCLWHSRCCGYGFTSCVTIEMSHMICFARRMGVLKLLKLLKCHSVEGDPRRADRFA